MKEKNASFFATSMAIVADKEHRDGSMGHVYESVEDWVSDAERLIGELTGPRSARCVRFFDDKSKANEWAAGDGEPSVVPLPGAGPDGRVVWSVLVSADETRTCSDFTDTSVFALFLKGTYTTPPSASDGTPMTWAAFYGRAPDWTAALTVARAFEVGTSETDEAQ